MNRSGAGRTQAKDGRPVLECSQRLRGRAEARLAYALASRGLGAVGGVDADVFGGEVAGPVAGGGWAGVEMEHDGDVFG